MIYLVTNQTALFESEHYTAMSVDDSIKLIESWIAIQFDTEADALDQHVGHLLTMQFGSPDGKDQVVVDCTTVNPILYKGVLEAKLLIGHNLKYDLQWLYNYGIHPLNVYCTMIAEQFIYLGFPSGAVKFSLQEVAQRYLGIYIDKEVRGEIRYKGLCDEVIVYAANDVVHLWPIMQKQIAICKERNAVEGCKIECLFTPVVAYLEWCGIKMDVAKWQAKMKQDQLDLENCIKALNDYCIKKPQLQKWVYVNTQGDLFEGYDLTPKFAIDWQKKEAIQVFKALGFNVSAVSKSTGEDSESKTEKLITSQKGIDDEFLRLYYGKGEPEDDDYYPGYNGSYKVVTSFGQGHINAINPITGRIHTNYKAIGTISGRMSSGSDQPNADLAKLKKIPAKECKYPNMQQLPKNAMTRSCFIAERGNLFCSCDYSAMEARIGADVYNEHKLLDEFLYGSGDTHAAYAKAVFAKELEGIDTKDIKKKRPDLRSKVKSVEFAVQFGSDGTAVAPQLKISVEEARQLVVNLMNGMTGLKSFKEKWSKFVLDHGYMIIMPQTGHKSYWHDWEHWKEVQASYTREFWDNYKQYHKGTGDDVCKQVKEHFQAKSKWCDRMSLNLPTQGGGAIVLKEAATALYHWVIDNGYWGKILFVNFTHDEINSEFPEELKDIYPNVVAQIMQDAAAKYYHKLPIPAVPEVGSHWIH